MKESYLATVMNCPTGHNARSRDTNGYSCDDCYRFIKTNTLEYLMTEGAMEIWMALNNRNVDKELPDELKKLMYKLMDDNYLYRLDKKESELLMGETYELLARYNIIDSEAVFLLKH